MHFIHKGEQGILGGFKYLQSKLWLNRHQCQFQSTLVNNYFSFNHISCVCVVYESVIFRLWSQASFVSERQGLWAEHFDWLCVGAQLVREHRNQPDDRCRFCGVGDRAIEQYECTVEKQAVVPQRASSSVSMKQRGLFDYSCGRQL